MLFQASDAPLNADKFPAVRFRRAATVDQPLVGRISRIRGQLVITRGEKEHFSTCCPLNHQAHFSGNCPNVVRLQFDKKMFHFTSCGYHFDRAQNRILCVVGGAGVIPPPAITPSEHRVLLSAAVNLPH